MLPRYPAPLRPGHRIAVTAPSSGVEPRLHARLDLVIRHLRMRGFDVVEGVCLRSQHRGASASADARAAELMHFALRDDVAAIIPPWGGELAVQLLDRLDWGALRQARPKWVLGYSDSSTWMLPLTLHACWATAHGPSLMDFVPSQNDELTRGALDVLATAAEGQVVQRQSDRWQSKWGDFATDPACTYALSEPTRWRALHGGRAVQCRGRLIGGCLDTLLHLAGSRHGDLPGFIARCGSDGVVLYLENAEQTPYGVLRALHHLRWAGWLDGLAGLLVGRSAGPDTTGEQHLRYEDALRDGLAHAHYPVLVDADIGHCPPQMVLVNGALAQVEWRADTGAVVTQRFV
jgi:muramoyltetrapeptide carboxypeptidase